MDKAQQLLLIAFKAEVDSARQRAKKLRKLSEYAAGGKKDMLQLASMEDESAKQYEKIMQNFKKARGL
jgi:hypothetical protein